MYDRLSNLLPQLLMKEGPYPLLMEPPDGGYRFEMGDYTSALGDDGVWRAQDISTEHYQLEKDNACHAYGKFFYKKVFTVTCTCILHTHTPVLSCPVLSCPVLSCPVVLLLVTSRASPKGQQIKSINRRPPGFCSMHC